MAAAEQIHDPLQVVVAAYYRMRIIMVAQVINLFTRQAEHEEVLFANFFTDLNVCAVKSTDGNGAVHHELHVAGAGSLLAGGGQLL